MIKRPSFQFYPSDWLRDTALRSCSMGARGLWMDMICYMHEGNPYGHLKVGDKVILPDNLARMVGETSECVEGWLQELKEANVYDLTTDGVMCSRRMIRDENLRQIRASGGKLGGNPNLKPASKVNLKDKQKTTPSSSSTSSSTKIDTAPPEGVSDSLWKDFLAIRKAKKLPMSETAIKGLMREAASAGKTLSEVLTICCERGWGGFNAKWLERDAPTGGSKQLTMQEEMALRARAKK